MRRVAIGLAVIGLLVPAAGAAQQPAQPASAVPVAPAPAAPSATPSGSTAADAPTSAPRAIPPELQPRPGKQAVAIPAKSAPPTKAAPARSTAPAKATGKGKQASRKARHQKEPDSHPVPPGAAVATFPGFKMLPDGGSRVFVEVSRKVDVTEHKAEGRITYRLKGAAVPIRTNRLPIDTTFFPSVVSRIQLVEQDGDTDLVIDTRQPTDAKHRVIDQSGAIVLEIDFPRSNVAAPPAATGRPTTTRSLRD